VTWYTINYGDAEIAVHLTGRKRPWVDKVVSRGGKHEPTYVLLDVWDVRCTLTSTGYVEDAAAWGTKEEAFSVGRGLARNMAQTEALAKERARRETA